MGHQLCANFRADHDHTGVMVQLGQLMEELNGPLGLGSDFVHNGSRRVDHDSIEKSWLFRESTHGMTCLFKMAPQNLTMKLRTPTDTDVRRSRVRGGSWKGAIANGDVESGHPVHHM
jgi:hypothetical protein